MGVVDGALRRSVGEQQAKEIFGVLQALVVHGQVVCHLRAAAVVCLRTEDGWEVEEHGARETLPFFRGEEERLAVLLAEDDGHHIFGHQTLTVQVVHPEPVGGRREAVCH